MPKLLRHLKRTTIITIATWFVVLLLFVLQKFIFSQADMNDTLVFVMVLLAIYLGVPTFLLCLIEWLAFIGELFKIKHLSQAIRYIVIMGFVYLVGDFISFMIERRVPDLGIKMVLFVHVVLAVWWVYGVCVGVISRMVFDALANRGVMLPNWLGTLLAILIAGVIYAILYMVLNELPFFDWFFK